MTLIDEIDQLNQPNTSFAITLSLNIPKRKTTRFHDDLLSNGWKLQYDEIFRQYWLTPINPCRLSHNETLNYLKFPV